MRREHMLVVVTIDCKEKPKNFLICFRQHACWDIIIVIQ